MSNFLTLKSVEDVLALIDEVPAIETEHIALQQASGRILTQDFRALAKLPGFMRSTVDGFAVQAKDVFGATEANPALLDLAGECVMGTAPDLRVEAGQTARIWTGGMLPEGADAVVMLEYSRPVGTKQIELTRAVAPADNTLAGDEDVSAGELLFKRGRRLYPQDLALLAALGQDKIAVRRVPSFGVIATGDEIILPNAPWSPGKVRESNSTMLCAMLETMGARAVNLGLVRDNLGELTQKLQQGLEEHDAVLVSGGSSAGQKDFTLPAFASLPGWEVLVHGIAIRPGKPTLFARNKNKFLWGLPGNPTAAFVVAEVFIRRFVQNLLGQTRDEKSWSRQVKARLSRKLASAQGRRDYIRVRLEASDEAYPLAIPLLGPSGLVSNPVKADGLVVCHELKEGLEAGELVDVQLLRV